MQKVKLYKNKVEIEFDEERHIYRDVKGNNLLSVTGITGVIDKSGALMGWVAKMMGLYLLQEAENGNDKITEELVNTAKREYRRISKEAADIGTEIHLWVSKWIKGQKPEMPENEKVINGITAFLKFQKANKIKWLESERIVYSQKYNYCGILDAIGKMGKELVVFDFKSSSGIYPEMLMQIAGYNIAYTEETGKNVDGKIIVQFGKETGEFMVKKLENDGKDEKAFLGALALKKRLIEIERSEN